MVHVSSARGVALLNRNNGTADSTLLAAGCAGGATNPFGCSSPHTSLLSLPPCDWRGRRSAHGDILPRSNKCRERHARRIRSEGRDVQVDGSRPGPHHVLDCANSIEERHVAKRKRDIEGCICGRGGYRTVPCTTRHVRAMVHAVRGDNIRSLLPDVDFANPVGTPSWRQGAQHRHKYETSPFAHRIGRTCG